MYYLTTQVLESSFPSAILGDTIAVQRPIGLSKEEFRKSKPHQPFCRSAPTLRSVGAPLYTTRERYNALSALLRERYLFWAAVDLLRRMGEGSFHS
jgi:hypothetical protein